MKKSKKIMGCILSVALGLFFLLVVVPFCFINWGHSSSYGKETIVLPDGEKVYVILESWGLHDTRISITKDSCGCKPANPDTDYYMNDNYLVIYKITDKGLAVFDGYNSWNKPKTSRGDNVEIIDYYDSEMLAHPEKFGVTVLRMVDTNQWCFRNLFRKSSSLRPDIRRW